MCSILDPFFKTNYKNSIFIPVHCGVSKALPLTKSNSTGLNTATNQTQISCRMRYSQLVQGYGTTKDSTSYVKKTCSLGGPTFSY